ncbi:MAG: FmdB family zinc ribbon protein [Anaerolineales bacterium]
MPTYKYICNICGRSFEKQLHFTDDVDHVSCPNGHQQTRRIFTAPSIVITGSGFYVPDRRHSSPNSKSS